MTVSPPRPDRWPRWFFRLVQTVGLVLGIHEALGAGRPFVLLFAGALILGAAGLRTMIRGASELAEAVPEEHDG